MSVITSEALRKLAALGLDGEQLNGVLDILADVQRADEERRAAQRSRTQKSRDKSRYGNVTVTQEERDNTVTSPPPPSPNDVLPNPEKPECNLTPSPTPYSPPPPAVISGWPRDWFELFYARYPRRQGRQDAAKAAKAVERMPGVSFAMVDAGLSRLIDSDPDPQFVPLPATWLRGRRWEDEAPAGRIRSGRSPPPQRKGAAMIFDEAISESQRDAANDSSEFFPAQPLRSEDRRFGGPVLEQGPGGSWVDAPVDFRQARAFRR